jgi:hypothetical protein
MSSKKSPKNSPKKTVKFIKNTFSIIQVKKMLGKKLIILWKGIPVASSVVKENAKKIKDSIISSNNEKQKNIVLSCVCLNGVLNIINGSDRILAISNISYDEIKKKNISDLNITILQYPKMSQLDIKKFVSSNFK